MRIWVVKDLEPLPIDAGDRRLMRSAMLCEALSKRGHEVSWITSTFDHYTKSQRTSDEEMREVAPNYKIVLLRAPGYRSNRSPLRVWHNHSFARSFRAFAAGVAQRPDVIVTDVPTTETAQAAIHVARLWGIPSLLSIRDLWPDFFDDFLPLVPKPLLRMAVSRFERQITYACQNATAIVGISGDYLEWGLNKGSRQGSALDGVAPLGYRPAVVSPAVSKEAFDSLLGRGVDAERTLVTFVGSWGATYDLETVLETASRLSHRKDIQFVLAGAGEGRKRLARRIDKLANVAAPGWLSATQIAALLERSTLGLAPYREAAPQGMPNKIFEYMAYGAFQISTLQGEVAELLLEMKAGKVIASGDPEAMAAAIVDAVEEAQQPGLRERIRAGFLARFEAEAVYANLAQRIENVAGSSLSPQFGTGVGA